MTISVDVSIPASLSDAFQLLWHELNHCPAAKHFHQRTHPIIRCRLYSRQEARQRAFNHSGYMACGKPQTALYGLPKPRNRICEGLQQFSRYLHRPSFASDQGCGRRFERQVECFPEIPQALGFIEASEQIASHRGTLDLDELPPLAKLPCLKGTVTRDPGAGQGYFGLAFLIGPAPEREPCQAGINVRPRSGHDHERLRGQGGFAPLTVSPITARLSFGQWQPLPHGL
jgi:hypothetical protein